MLHGTRVQKLPSAHRPADAWFHVSLLFVTRDARGCGIGEVVRLCGSDSPVSDELSTLKP